MRFIKSSILVCVCIIIYMAGFLALKSFQAEGASLKTCVLMSGPFLIWLAYQMINLISERIHSIEDYKFIIRRMQEQMDHHIDIERAVGGGSRLMKGIQECRQSALAIKHPGMEDISLTLSRLAYIEHLLNVIAPTLLREMSERDRQMWERAINELPAIQANTPVTADSRASVK
ncbi:hypothetical protein [Pantoea stewartii]|uniref:hypothetical protein n=1 Tax=Pantoea stewartii TaxID=66269 RepID=UPI0025A02DFC|nr:hypothetical protein [Pantoea stewartii]